MRYRQLGSTGISVSEIGFGGEWMDKTVEETRAVLERADAAGVNILDCWMPDPTRRSNLGDALAQMGARDRWVIQGHLGSTWQDGQYVRTREMEHVRPTFEDLLARFHTDYMDLGMIHYVDRVDEFRQIMDGSPFICYVRELRDAGTVRHVGLSTHNPDVARLAVEDPEIEMILFSVNPAFDMLPASEDIDDLFGEYDASLEGIDPQRAALYAEAERTGTGITVMKGYAGGRLLDVATSPFGVALTPIQCIHYALTRPAVASIMVGFSEPGHVDGRSPTRRPTRGSSTTRACWRAPPRTPTSASARTAATAPRARAASTSRRSTSSTTWPPSTTRCRIRCASTTARSR